MQPLTVPTPDGRLLTLISAIPNDDADEEGFPRSVRHVFAVYADDETPPVSPICVDVETRVADRHGGSVWRVLQEEAVRRLKAILCIRMRLDFESGEAEGPHA